MSSTTMTTSPSEDSNLLRSSCMDAEQRMKTFKLVGTVQDAMIYNKTIDIEWEKIASRQNDKVQSPAKPVSSSPKNPKCVPKSPGLSKKIVQLVYVTLSCIYYDSNGDVLKKSAACELRNDYTVLQALQKLIQDLHTNIDFTVNPPEARLYRVVYTSEDDKLIELQYAMAKDTIIADIASDDDFRLQLDFTYPIHSLRWCE